jgi:signal transduction histidine kinase
MASPEVEAGLARLVLGDRSGERVRTAGTHVLLADADIGAAKGLLVASRVAGEFGALELSLAGLICTQLSFAVPITQYVSDLKVRRDRAECLRRIAVRVAGSSSPDEAMRSIAEEMAAVLPLSRVLWMVGGSDSHIWVSEIYNRAGPVAGGTFRLSVSGEAKSRHLRALENARGRSFCEISEGRELGQRGSQRGDASSGECPFRVRAGSSRVGTGVVARLEEAGLVPRGEGGLLVAPVMLSQGSWSLLCAATEQGAALKPDDTCFVCVAASTLAYVWRAADSASAVRRLRAASETVCDLVHDLKYPINKMRGDLEALEESCVPGSPGADGLAAIKRDLDNLKTLSDEVCEVASPANRKPEMIDIGEMVEHCLSLLSAELAAKAIEVKRDLVGVPPIFADRRDVSRVMLNILGNGVEAVAAKGHMRIGATSQEVRPGARSVSVIFEDSGPGVREGDVHRIFDPFFTTREGGSGLGLFSARKRAQANGGDVTCEIDGGRSRFVATFPAAVG